MVTRELPGVRARSVRNRRWKEAYSDMFEMAMLAVYRMEKKLSINTSLDVRRLRVKSPWTRSTWVPMQPNAAWRAVKRNGYGNYYSSTLVKVRILLALKYQ